MTRRTALSTLLVAAAAVAVPAFAAPLVSGLKLGEAVTPFHPKHLAGPLAGTTNCFPCTFQDRPQVQAWVNGADKATVVAFAKTLATEMKDHEKQEFKALVVVLTDKANAEKAENMVREATKVPGTEGVGLAVLLKTDEAVKNYSINTDASIKNTVFVYKKWTVEQKFVNLKTSETQKLVAAIDGITK